MNKFCIILSIALLGSSVFAVEQRYMPDGYVRDDVIYPYYAKLSGDYFKKVDSGQIKFDRKTYRKEVEIPLSKITDELFKQSRKMKF